MPTYLRRNVRRVKRARTARSGTVRRVYTTRAKNMAARTIQNRWRARAVRRIGEPLGAQRCKSVISEELYPVLRNSGTLYGVDCTRCIQGNEANNRERGIIECRGIKIDLYCENNWGAQNNLLNIALVAVKSTDAFKGNIPTGTNFFRLAGVDRSIDFSSLSLDPFRRHTYSINADDYTVLWHKRRILAGKNSATLSSMRNGSMLLRTYTKIKRQVRYDSGEDAGATDGRIYMVYWFGPATFAADPITAGLNISYNIEMYFKDVH